MSTALPDEPPPRGRALSLAIKALVAIVVTIVALWWAFNDVHFDEIAPRLAATNWSVIAVYTVCFLIVHLLRVVRWGLLVKPLGPVTHRGIFSAASVGIPAAMFLPLRLGEFVRPVMLARSGVPFAGGLASVVVERVADGLTNVGLFFLLLAMMPADAPIPDNIRWLSKIALGVFGSACVVLVIIGFARATALSMIRRILAPISATLSEKIVGLLENFLIGLRPLATPRRMIAFLILTAGYWGLNGWATWLVITSYGVDVPFIAGPFAVSVLVFAVMIPAGPAFAGTMEVGFKAGLAPFGVGSEGAAVVAIAIHILQIVLLAIIIGIGFLAAEPAQRRDSDPAT